MAVAKNNYNKSNLEDHFCAYCGEPIIVKNKKVRFCSDNCRIASWRKYKKEKLSLTNKKKK